MKIIKLHPRFKLYKEGYTHAIRFDRWTPHGLIDRLERKMEELFGTQYAWKTQSNWRGAFGSNRDPKTGYKPYFIAVRNPSHLTIALLATNNQGK